MLIDIDSLPATLQTDQARIFAHPGAEPDSSPDSAHVGQLRGACRTLLQSIAFEQFDIVDAIHVIGILSVVFSKKIVVPDVNYGQKIEKMKY